MDARAGSRVVRAAGAGALFMGATGLASTVATLIRLLALGGLGAITRTADANVALAFLVANLFDCVAYLAALVVGLRLLDLNTSARHPGRVLAFYFIFMALVQPAAVYIWIQRPQAEALDGESATSQILAAPLGASLQFLGGLGLLWAISRWGRLPSPSFANALPRVPQAKGKRAATNAPRHWPAVDVDEWMPQLPFYGQLAVIAALSEGFKQRLRSEVRISLQRLRLYEDGVLRIPVLIEEGRQQTAVFIYSEASPENAAHYSGARALLRQREAASAVYYAPEPLTSRTASGVLERLDTPHFTKPEKERPAAEYALWWPTPEEPRLRDSPALAHLDAWFEALDSYSYLLFSSFAKELELTGKEEFEVYGLPVQPVMLPVDGPGDLALYFHASQEEGLWLAFDVKQTSSVVRNRLLAQLAELARRARHVIEASGGKLPARREDQARALYFWKRTRQEALDAEVDGRSDMRLGSIIEVGSTRLRIPGASVAEQRAAQASHARPSEALTQFVREQLDRGFSLLASRSAGTDPAGGPNFHPFVAIQAGPEIHHVTLWSFEEPEAVLFCPVIAAEHGVLDMIALVCDGIVRLDEERFDALVVHAQQAREGRCHTFMQRYRLVNEKAGALGNWLLKDGDASLLRPQAEPQAAPEPSPALAAFVAETVESTLVWIRTGDGSGAELYHEREPLFSPALHLRIGDENHMQRFMLGNLAWAQGATLQTLAERPQASLAVFVYDFVAERNGQPARSLRFHAHERGASGSWLYAQAYQVPVPGSRFETIGALAFVRPGRPLFPA